MIQMIPLIQAMWNDLSFVCNHKSMGMYGVLSKASFVKALIQWHRVYKFGKDELHIPLFVALTLVMGPRKTHTK